MAHLTLFLLLLGTASAAFDASTGYGTDICLTANSACPAGETSTCPSAAKVKGMSSLMYACAHPWKYHITVLTGHAVPPSPPTTMQSAMPSPEHLRA